MNRYITIFMFLMLCGRVAFAQSDKSEITVEGEMRTRGEMRQGQGTLRAHEDKPAYFVNERARVGVDWQKDNLEVKVSAQHTGVWGDTSQKSSAGDISVNEAWAKYSFLGGDAYVQAGRQTLSYDDERILGADDWSTTGRHHDALKLVYKHGKHEVNLVGAYNQNSEKTIGSYYQGNTAGYKNLQMVWYHFGVEKVGVSALFLNHGIEVGSESKPESRYMKTVGGRVTVGNEETLFSADASGYYQFGKDRVNKDTKAYLVSANAYLHLGKSLTIGGGGDLLSGTEAGSMEQHTFNVLYGSCHNFYGAMDYFEYGTIPTQGLIDMKANVAYRFGEKGDVRMDYHAFGIPEFFNYQGTGVAPGRKVGHEVDLQGGYQLHKNLELRGGYSVIFPLRTLGLLKSTSGGDTGAWQHWAWVSASIKI